MADGHATVGPFSGSLRHTLGEWRTCGGGGPWIGLTDNSEERGTTLAEFSPTLTVRKYVILCYQAST